MSKCTLCPRRCGADRTKERGFCGAGSDIRVARAALHKWEEPPVSAGAGSGAVFFSGCSLRCEFCQNAQISRGCAGKAVTPERLYDIFFELKAQGAANINLVTADHWLPQIAPAALRAREDGLGLPFVLNTSSYLSKEQLSLAARFCDVYLADLKYTSPALAMKYSLAPDYPETARAAIDAMYGAAGAPVVENGAIKRGVIVRVLALPGAVIDAKASVKYLYGRYGDGVFISIMGQYVPMPGCLHRELRGKLPPSSYRSIVRYARSLGVTRGFIQDAGADDHAYIPAFDLEGV